MPEQPDDRLALTPTQHELYKALVGKRADVAVCYQAAVVILNDDVVPDRLSLAAHALRELMEKLPSEEMTIDTGADLNTKVKVLEPLWASALTEDEAQGDKRWTNGIGAALRTFLIASAEFFKGRGAIRAGRGQQAALFLNRLDVAAMRLPADMQRKNTKEWMDLRKYFTNVAHHRFPVEETAFQEHVNQFEGFLYARLIPRPTADFAAIDALLQEE